MMPDLPNVDFERDVHQFIVSFPFKSFIIVTIALYFLIYQIAIYKKYLFEIPFYVSLVFLYVKSLLFKRCRLHVVFYNALTFFT